VIARGASAPAAISVPRDSRSRGAFVCGARVRFGALDWIIAVAALERAGFGASNRQA